ncbi:MAG: hypothetical protein KDC10_11510 [Calditrichaeota bacterium]|nr:hypothetical protein [Calditrichota bacterium]
MMHSEEILSWWGYRLRLPPISKLVPPTRLEQMIAFSLVSLALEIGFLILCLISSMVPILNIDAGDTWRIAALLIAVPAAMGMILPQSLLEWLRVSPWLVMAREKGNLKRLDFWMVLLSAALTIMSFFSLDEFWGPPLCLTCVAMLTATGFPIFSASGVGFRIGRKHFELPEWLTPNEDVPHDPSVPEAPEHITPVLLPEPEANVRYNFRTQDKASFPVGIYVPAELVDAMRDLNSQYGGRLYQQQPEAIILLDRAPATGLGRDELSLLCRQIAAIGSHQKLSRMQFANHVLAFVQEAIEYRFDKDSTKHVRGGPYDEYGRFAIETLYDRVGDCECTAILAGSLLTTLGFRCALLLVHVPDANGEISGHAAIGLDLDDVLPGECADGLDLVALGARRFLYGETACDGCTMAFGAIPEDWSGLTLQDKGVIPVAIGSHS